jgi:hypothetical protein
MGAASSETSVCFYHTVAAHPRKQQSSLIFEVSNISVILSLLFSKAVWLGLGEALLFCFSGYPGKVLQMYRPPYLAQ